MSNTSVPSDVPIPPCSVYLEELKHCKSFSSKIQRYYADLPSDDCSRWKEIYQTCLKWENEKDAAAKCAVMKFEHDRHMQIINNRTNVWEYRKEPPATWARPGLKLAEKIEEHHNKVENNNRDDS